MIIKFGIYQGRKIKIPSIETTKPTKSKIREALFNILLHNNKLAKYRFDKNDISFLELFSGSAIVSFEAVSLGAKKTIAIDNNSSLRRFFLVNKSFMAENTEFDFVNCDATNLPKREEGFADICFIDPPYYKNLEEKTVQSLLKNNWLKNDSLVIIETARKIDLADNLANLKLLFCKRYGSSKLYFYKKTELISNCSPSRGERLL